MRIKLVGGPWNGEFRDVPDWANVYEGDDEGAYRRSNLDVGGSVYFAYVPAIEFAADVTSSKKPEEDGC